MKQVVLAKENQKQIIQEAVLVLQQGGLLVFPTETCYGVGVDATNKEAVNKLISYKERPEGKAISIAVADKNMAEQFVVINKTAENIYQNFLPGPVTVVSESRHTVAQGIEAEDGSLGVRIPKYPFMLQLIKAFGKPITATSANRSGRKTPYAVQDIFDTISEKKKRLIDYIIDAGELPHNPPSTVVDTRLNDISVLRQGELKLNKSNSTIYSSKNAEETQALGATLTEKLVPKLSKQCILFALQGDLGAGKTQFAKGVGRALNIYDTISSPTFALLKEYPFSLKIDNVKGTFYHIDTWRMQNETELSLLGFDKMIVPGNVIVIEWLEKVSQTIKKIEQTHNVIVVWISIEDSESEIRKITTIV